jgi:hypothetical protein
MPGGGFTDATIQKRTPVHPARASSPTRRKQSGRQDNEAGLCIYLTRQSSLPHVAERIVKSLEDGKNSKSCFPLFSLWVGY